MECGLFEKLKTNHSWLKTTLNLVHQVNILEDGCIIIVK